MKIYQIWYINSYGEKEFVALTDNPEEWIKDNNKRRIDEGNEPEELDDFDLFGDDHPPAKQPEETLELPPQLDDPQVPMHNPKPKRHPGDPTEAEIDAHNLTHANYRSWCAICNRAALKEDPHYRQTKQEIKDCFPVVSFDYKTMGESEKKMTRSHA